MHDLSQPAVPSRIRVLFVVIFACLVLLIGLALYDAFSASHPAHTNLLHPLTPQEQQQASQLARARTPVVAESGWIESRDGDGTLDVEDVNGPGTIYFDKQSRTRLLCIDNNGCYPLHGHHEGSK